MEIFFSNIIEKDLCTLPPNESWHCVKVLRYVCGQKIMIFDGKGTLYEGQICDNDSKAVKARIVAQNKNWEGHPYELNMAVCPPKNIDRYEWFVEKATELGVDGIIPIAAKHSERRRVNIERLEKLVLGACKQSLKAKLPEISGIEAFKDFVDRVDTDDLNMIAFCSEHEGKKKILDVLKEVNKAKINVLIGPEGDFSNEEIDYALQKGFIPISLGKSRLRIETAALCVVEAVYLMRNL